MYEDIKSNRWLKELPKDWTLSEDLKKVHGVKKVLMTNDFERQAVKMSGLKDPFSVSGSKAKDIVKHADMRYGQVFLGRQTHFDLEARTRMKIGSDQEDYLVKEIAPLWLTDEGWDGRVFVIDKRRYIATDLEGNELPISVEYDILCYKMNPEFWEDITGTNKRYAKGNPKIRIDYTVDSITGNILPLGIIDPNTEVEYASLDNLVAKGALVPDIIFDLKNTKQSIGANTKNYVYQLSLGCWMMPEFKKHSILNMEENARMTYWITDYDESKSNEIWTAYNKYLKELVWPTINAIEKNDQTESEYQDVFSLWQANFKGTGTDPEINLEYTDEDLHNIIMKLEELIPIKVQIDSLTKTYKAMTDEINEYKLPLDQKPFAQVGDKKLTAYAFEGSPRITYDLPKLESELNLLGATLTMNLPDGTTKPINLRDYAKTSGGGIVRSVKISTVKGAITPEGNWE